MSSQKQVIRNSIIYTISNILLKAFSFLLLPLYTSYLTLEDYGITGLIASFTSVAQYIITFSIFSSVVKFYTEYKDNLDKVRRLFGTIFAFVFISGLVFFVLFFILRRFMLGYFFRGLSYYPTIFIALSGLVFNSLYLVYISILQALQHAKKTGIISIVFFFLNLFLNLIFVVWLRLGANGVLLSSSISYLVFAIYATLNLHRSGLIELCIDKSLLLQALRYSIPLLPHNLSTTIAQLVSKVLINKNYSLSSVGIFNVASQFGSIADMLQSSVHSAFTPWMYIRLKESRSGKDEQIVSLTNLLMAMYGFLFLCLSFFSQEALFLLTNRSYYDAWMLIPLIVISYTIKIIYYFYIDVMFYYLDLSNKIFWATLSSAFLNILLSIIFIPKWDIYGSVLADILAMILRTTIIVLLARRRLKFGYRIGNFIIFEIITISFIGAGLIPSYLKFGYTVSISNIIYKISILVIYSIIIALYFKINIRLLIEGLKNKKWRIKY